MGKISKRKEELRRRMKIAMKNRWKKVDENGGPSSDGTLQEKAAANSTSCELPLTTGGGTTTTTTASASSSIVMASATPRRSVVSFVDNLTDSCGNLFCDEQQSRASSTKCSVAKREKSTPPRKKRKISDTSIAEEIENEKENDTNSLEELAAHFYPFSFCISTEKETNKKTKKSKPEQNNSLFTNITKTAEESLTKVVKGIDPSNPISELSGTPNEIMEALMLSDDYCQEPDEDCNSISDMQESSQVYGEELQNFIKEEPYIIEEEIMQNLEAIQMKNEMNLDGIGTEPEKREESIDIKEELLESFEEVVQMIHKNESRMNEAVKLPSIGTKPKQRKDGRGGKDHRDSSFLQAEKRRKMMEGQKNRKQAGNNPYDILLPSDKAVHCVYSEVNCWNKGLSNKRIICDECGNASIYCKIRETKIKVFVPTIELWCRSCKELITHFSASEKFELPAIGNKDKMNTNRANVRFCVGVLSSGIGFQKGVQLLDYLNLYGLSKSKYHKLQQQILEIGNNLLEEMKSDASKTVFEAYLREGYKPDEEDIMSIIVEFYGTWIKHGQASKFGIAFVIDSLTGLILDVEIKSQYCHQCQVAEKQYENNKRKLSQWQKDHKASFECCRTYNIETSLESNELQSAITMFKRSIDRKLKYTTIVSDKDNSAYTTLIANRPYGTGAKNEIKKISNITYMTKNIVEKINKEKKEAGLGGRGRGKMADNMDHMMANIWRAAVQINLGNSHNKVRHHMEAAIAHHAATDENPCHDKCPKGADSWCAYNKSVAEGKTPEEGWHNDINNIKYFISRDCADLLRRIFSEMTKGSMLDKIIGKTQNINETLLSKIWKLMPKNTFIGINHIVFAVVRVAFDHNWGSI